MKIQDLMKQIDYRVLQEGTPDWKERQVTQLVYDSRKVTPGACFACESGLVFDGTTFLEAAARSGAVLAVMEKEPEQYPQGLTMLLVTNVRQAMAAMAKNFYPAALEGVRLIGMTGTNGKTTTSTLMHYIWMQAGISCGLIGTNENRIGERHVKATHTTPYPFDLYPLFETMKEAGNRVIVMEVSSHALDQHRVEGVRYQLGMFTNLSQDHLDYHKTMQAYLEAKCKLFYQSERALINGDDAVAPQILATQACPFTTFGLGKNCDYRAEAVTIDAEGLSYDWYFHNEKLGHIHYPVPGQFNVYNTLAAISACHMEGLSAQQITESIDAIRHAFVPGRFQVFRGSDGVTAVVDYAHTPDGLKNILETAAEFTKGRIITVFGCGGDRDNKKRPIMGEIAGRLSQYAIITSDNPRTENPDQIIAEIEAGLAPTHCPYATISDRRQAIAQAIAMAQPEDTVVVAGKGHEDYQIIGREKIHLDDREEVQKALQTRSQISE